MNNISKTIAWADKSWNPISGCTPASTGCLHCYARRNAVRFNGGDFSIRFHPERLKEIRCRWTGRIFVCSVSDFYHDQVKPDWRRQVFDAIFANSLILNKYLFLTKRPENIGKSTCQLNPSLWFGASIENQAAARRRIPLLVAAPVANRFLSVEPMLEPIDIKDYLADGLIKWVICGPETGRGARACDPKWITDLHRQCERFNIPFWDKRDDWICRQRPIGLQQ